MVLLKARWLSFEEFEGRTHWERGSADGLTAGQDSGLPSESFTHVVANIMFPVVPDSEAALKGRMMTFPDPFGIRVC